MRAKILVVEPLQTDEVVKALRECGDCAITHVPTDTTVRVLTDGRNEQAPWLIEYEHYDILDKPVLKQALELGLELGAVILDQTRYVLHRNCFGIRAAAIKALLLARLLPGVPENAWLWITARDTDPDPYDLWEMPPPDPPVPWPPEDPR